MGFMAINLNPKPLFTYPKSPSSGELHGDCSNACLACVWGVSGFGFRVWVLQGTPLNNQDLDG